MVQITFDQLAQIPLESIEFTHPWVLYLVPAAALLLLILTLITVSKFENLDPEQIRRAKKKRRRWRVGIFLSRLVIVCALIVALAGPHIQEKSEVDGNLQLVILMDNSTSMDVYNKAPIESMVETLKTMVPTKVFTIARGLDSAIGNGVLAHLEADTQYLVVSDGNVNAGSSLADVAVFANALNSTISALTLFPEANDVGVEVIGPSKSIESVENTFKVKVNTINVQDYTIKVWLDDALIIDRRTSEESFTFTEVLGPGEHQIRAEVSPRSGPDYFPENNVYYKTITIVEKPDILVVRDGESSEFQIVKELYNATFAKTIPDDLSSYSAIILKDIHKNQIDAEQMIDYVTGGNGLLVFGGTNSFDSGEYENSLFEKMLPVEVGTGEEDDGTGVNVVVVMDISKSGKKFKASRQGATDQENFQKALAIGIVDGLKENTNVGVVAFRDISFLVSRMRKAGAAKADIIDKIARIQFARGALEQGTNIYSGLSAAHQVVNKFQGSKNVILISDGEDNPKTSERDSQILNLIRQLGGREYRFYTVSPSPESNTKWLKRIAKEGKGFYFEPTTKQKLKILFGPPESLPSNGLSAVVTLDEDHFITRKIQLDAYLNAYDEVRPKSTAQQLLALETGQPVFTIWRYGLGRVGTLNAYNARGDLGQLTDKNNAKILPRMVNWAVGDPERTKSYVVSVADARLGSDVEVLVKADKFPTADGYSFSRIDENLYAASVRAEELGFHNVLGKPYAINYHKEYRSLGVSPEFERLIVQAGGRLFHPTEAEDIHEFVKSRSKRIKIEKINIQWPLLLLAIAVLLIEITIRRIVQTFFH